MLNEGNGTAGLHLHPLDAQRAGQLQSDPSEGGCLQHKHLQIVFTQFLMLVKITTTWKELFIFTMCH